jgi:hypothetical protein
MNGRMSLLISILSVIFLFSAIIGFVGQLAQCRDFPTKFVSLALSISVLSYAYWLGLVFHLGLNLILLIVLSVSLLLWLLSFSFPRKINVKSFFKDFIQDSKAAFVASIAVLILTLHFNKYVYRWGDWDAWSIWNLHAKFLFDSEYWRNMFTDNMAITHPDYPLMLPTLIAFFWKCLGYITPVTPIILAYVVFLAVPLAIFKTLYTEKRPVFAFAALLIFSADTKYVSVAGSQYADTLVAFFILISFIIYNRVNEFRNKNLLFLLGYIAAATTWIKNEGLLFYAAFTFIFLCFHYRQPLAIFKYLSGSALPLLILITFKTFFAPANDLIHAKRSDDLVLLILQPDRYLLIASHFLQTFWNYYWIVLVLAGFIFVKGIHSLRTFPVMVLLIVISGYLAVYLTTPHDLGWHLGASVDRVLHHIYPTTVYLLLKTLMDAGDSDNAFKRANTQAPENKS